METRIRGMEQSVKDIKDSLERIGAGRDASQNVNTIKLEAGTAGVWLCVCMCGMMLVAMLMGAVWMSREFNRYDSDLSERKAESDRSQTYLSSIYGRMPQWMREEVEKEASSKLAEKEKQNAQR